MPYPLTFTLLSTYCSGAWTNILAKCKNKMFLPLLASMKPRACRFDKKTDIWKFYYCHYSKHTILPNNNLWTLKNKWFLWNHSFSTYIKFSEKLAFISPWYVNARVRIRGARNVSFSENFAFVLNEWFLFLKKLRITAISPSQWIWLWSEFFYLLEKRSCNSWFLGLHKNENCVLPLIFKRNMV